MNLIKPPKKRRLIQSWRSYYRWYTSIKFNDEVAIFLDSDGNLCCMIASPDFKLAETFAGIE